MYYGVGVIITAGPTIKIMSNLTACFFEKMDSYIAPDLFRAIIEYIPILDLRDLSRASPIFDAVICKALPKIVYHGNQYFLAANGLIIIKDSTGIVRSLKETDSSYRDDNKTYHHYMVLFMNDTVPGKKYTKDILANYCAIINKTAIRICKPTNVRDVLSSDDTMSVYFDKFPGLPWNGHIDIINKYLVDKLYNVTERHHHIYLVGFRVITVNDDWYKPREN